MRRSKFFSIIVIAMAVIFATVSAEALVKKPQPKPKTSKSATTKTAKSKAKKATPAATSKTSAKKSKKGRKTPYILAPTPEVTAPELPHPHRFSPELSDHLARGNLAQVYHDLQLETASDKVGYMINQVLMAQGKGMGHGRGVTSFDRAVAWHNLYLFLARQGRPAPKFVKEAAKYYQKAARKPQYADKANILLAALYATAGDTAKSEKYFGKVDVAALTHGGEDYNGLEYLATYYAAVKQPHQAIAYLDQAYKLSPGSLLQWLHVGDDFWAIEDDAGFEKQVEDWTIAHHQRITQLQRDKSTHGARKKAALTTKTKKKKATSSPRKQGSRK